MNNLARYLPQDRRRTLASGQTLPDRAQGAVLFADISGFTPFTEALRHAYGPRRGTEELTKHLDAVYTALIVEVEQYGGSVTGFAGDAITCWFDELDGPAPPRAVACAVALQTAMRSFAEIQLPKGEIGQLTIKIGLATGDVRRLVVGDAAHYWLDVLAGETVNRTAVAEQLATGPEILLDTATAEALGDTITLTEWRTSMETGQQFGVLGQLAKQVEVLPVAPLPKLDEETTRPWLNPLVYEREKTGHDLLQTDFRPCVALFVRFVGIDYEADTAADQLNQFIRPLQAILAHYEGTLIDLTFGDKGSYLYINFGALSIHEDDARRACKTALRLCEAAQTLPFMEPLQIGINSGVMRTGAYGGVTRRHYGALGDDVNVAARLMSTAVSDQILLSEAVYQATQNDFTFEPHALLPLRGKTDPIRTYRLIATQPVVPPLLHEPTYILPMVGRQAELATMAQKLDLASAGTSQIVSLVGEAGLGKSRLAAEGVRLAHGRGFASYGGACQADGLNTPYLVWKQIWRSFFGLDPHQPHATQRNHLREQMRRYAPERVEALPLLGRLLDLPLPETKWTEQLEPKNRQNALHALLEDCLKQACTTSPLFILIEDLHWIDALSHDLLMDLARSCAAYPIFFLLVYRPTELPRLQAPRLESLSNFIALPLAALTEAEAHQIIQAKLSQLYPDQANEVAPVLSQTLLRRAEGNPFYLEELLNYLHGRGLDPRTATSWEIDLPDTLHALILSRLDQLQPSQKRTMRVASIIGRLFPVSWLIGYYPALGDLSQVQADLAVLHDRDLTLLDSTEPELAYLFKHIITHEVTYESLPYATRARLHEQLAAYLEEINAPLDSIAYHYGQSENCAKQITYFRQAGKAAQKNYANQAALDYYDRLLPLLADDPAAQRVVRIEQGTIYTMKADYDRAKTAYTAALELAERIGSEQAIAEGYYYLGTWWSLRADPEAFGWFDKAEALFTALDNPHWLAQTDNKRANLLVRQARYAEAHTHIDQALEIAKQVGDMALEGKLLALRGTILFYQGDYAGALAVEEQALTIFQALDAKFSLTMLLSNMGQVYSVQGLHEEARHFYKRSLTLAQMIGDKPRLINTSINLGLLLYEEGELVEAQRLQEQSLASAQQVGHNYAECIALLNLGNIAVARGVAVMASERYRAALQVAQALGDQNNIFYSLNGLAATAVLKQNLPRAARLAAAAETLRLSLGTAWDAIEGRMYEETITAVRQALSAAEFQAAWAEGEAMNLEQCIADALAV